MDQNASDQGWRQLQANIERFLEQSLRSDGGRIEYKPKFIGPLSGLSTEHPQGYEALPRPRPAPDIVRKKGGPSNALHKR